VPPVTLSPFSYNSFDSATILMQGVEETAFVGDDGSLYIPRAELVDAVRNTTDYVGIGGTYTCDETGECNASGPAFETVEDGVWKVLK